MLEHYRGSSDKGGKTVSGSSRRSRKPSGSPRCSFLADIFGYFDGRACTPKWKLYRPTTILGYCISHVIIFFFFGVNIVLTSFLEHWFGKQTERLVGLMSRRGGDIGFIYYHPVENSTKNCHALHSPEKKYREVFFLYFQGTLL